MQSRLFAAVCNNPLTSLELAERFNLSAPCIRGHMMLLKRALEKTDWQLTHKRHYGYMARKQR